MLLPQWMGAPLIGIALVGIVLLPYLVLITEKALRIEKPETRNARRGKGNLSDFLLVFISLWLAFSVMGLAGASAAMGVALPCDLLPLPGNAS